MEIDPLKPRKRPQQARSTVTVDAIVEAAARILEKEGFDGYTTNAIARLAGVSIGSLYQYFPTKDAITRQLICRQIDGLLADIRMIGQNTTGRDALQRFVNVAVDHQLRRPALARLLDQLESRLPPNTDTNQIGPTLVTIFATCLTDPAFAKSPNTEQAAGDLIAIIKGMVDAAGARGETEQTPLAARVMRAVFGYLAIPDDGLPNGP